MKLIALIKNKLNKWDLYLYYNGILIKKLKIKETEEPTKNTYVINVWFKKQLFANNKVNIIVRPKYIIKNDEKRKKTYWEVVFEKGIEI